MTKEELVQLNELINKTARDLTEHFDSVRIFVTMTDSEKGDTFTRCATTGYGNFWASLGYIRHWVAKKDEDARVESRSGGDEETDESLKDDDDPSDEYSDWNKA